MELDELSNLDKSRAQLAKELAEVKAAMARRAEEGSKDKDHRSNFTEQRAAIKAGTPHRCLLILCLTAQLVVPHCLKDNT